MWKIFLVTVTFVATATAQMDPVLPGEAPWHVSVQSKLFGTITYHTFSGVIIDENHILTSADIHQDVLPLLTLLVGRVDLNGFGGQRRNIEKMTFHHDFHVVWPVLDFPNRNDIALFKVSEPFVWDDNVQPIPLPSRNQSLAGQSSLLTGWQGPVIDGNGSLKKVTMPLISHQLCDTFYGKYRIPAAQMFCGGLIDNEGGAVDLVGLMWDRGSPLACQDDQDGSAYLCGMYVHTAEWHTLCYPPTPPGINASKTEPCRQNPGSAYPSAFLDISKYVAWIDDMRERSI